MSEDPDEIDTDRILIPDKRKAMRDADTKPIPITLLSEIGWRIKTLCDKYPCAYRLMGNSYRCFERCMTLHIERKENAPGGI